MSEVVHERTQPFVVVRNLLCKATKEEASGFLWRQKARRWVFGMAPMWQPRDGGLFTLCLLKPLLPLK
jgi:hypothetical protein